MSKFEFRKQLSTKRIQYYFFIKSLFFVFVNLNLGSREPRDYPGDYLSKKDQQSALYDYWDLRKLSEPSAYF